MGGIVVAPALHALVRGHSCFARAGSWSFLLCMRGIVVIPALHALFRGHSCFACAGSWSFLPCMRWIVAIQALHALDRAHSGFTCAGSWSLSLLYALDSGRLADRMGLEVATPLLVPGARDSQLRGWREPLATNFVAVSARGRQTLAERDLACRWPPIKAWLSTAPTARYNEHTRLSKPRVYPTIILSALNLSTYEMIVLSTYHIMILSACERI
jgi:hypothetical protein